ncbi:MAG TPA: aspartyl/asparaginyl beta-hydroxylase domain-containing protein [Actinopolymorphaceae bacterium]
MTADWVQAGRTALTRWVSDGHATKDEVERLLLAFDYHDRRRRRGAAPMQNPEFFCPDLTARPWHDPATFPWIRDLEAATDDIREEFFAARQRNELAAHAESKFARSGEWNTHYFYAMGHASTDHLASSPRTAAALAKIPGTDSAGMCYFSVLSPNTHLPAHCGFFNTRLRCHLGLVVPPDCWMRVGRERREWRESTCLVFDDSFEHEIRTGPEGERVVLLLDFWHPDLTETERLAMRHLMSVWRPIFGW